MTFWLCASPRRSWSSSPRSSVRSRRYGRSSRRFATDEPAATARRQQGTDSESSRAHASDGEHPVMFRVSAVASEIINSRSSSRGETTRPAEPWEPLATAPRPAGKLRALSDKIWPRLAYRATVRAALGQCQSRHALHLRKADLVPITPRCLTCKAELPVGVTGYCNEVCFLKATRTKRSPGRTAARRRRRRGGRKL